MKHKYITKQILLACRPKASTPGKNIHTLLEETMEERRRILPAWERLFLSHQISWKSDIPLPTKDIHTQLAETIAAYKRMRKQWEMSIRPPQEKSLLIQNKEAA